MSEEDERAVRRTDRIDDFSKILEECIGTGNDATLPARTPMTAQIVRYGSKTARDEPVRDMRVATSVLTQSMHDEHGAARAGTAPAMKLQARAVGGRQGVSGSVHG